MKKWIRPVGKIETFVPNDSVASTCWGVACSIGRDHDDPSRAWQKRYEGQFAGYNPNDLPHHDHNHCGSISNQVLFDDNGDGLPNGMKEINSINPDARGGELPCIVYTDGTYTTPMTDLRGIQNGQTIYWTNKGTGKTWHHQGTVQLLGGNTTNHS